MGWQIEVAAFVSIKVPGTSVIISLKLIIEAVMFLIAGNIAVTLLVLQLRR